MAKIEKRKSDVLYYDRLHVAGQSVGEWHSSIPIVKSTDKMLLLGTPTTAPADFVLTRIARDGVDKLRVEEIEDGFIFEGYYTKNDRNMLRGAAYAYLSEREQHYATMKNMLGTYHYGND